MGFSALKAMLDRLEPRFLDDPKRKPPKWLPAWPAFPTRRLTPSQPCGIKPVLWWALWSGLIVDLGSVLPLACMVLYAWLGTWRDTPAPLRSDLPRLEYMLPILGPLLFWSVFNMAIMLVVSLPAWYFWNRRAARLRRDGPSLSIESTSAASADPRVWPPPPSKPERLHNNLER